MPFPIIKNAPYISVDQMIEVDRLMIEEFGISLLQMMENAGRSLAILARKKFLAGNAAEKSILVMAGPGGNGGGAMVAARRLAGWGAKVSVVLSHPEARIKNVPLHQLSILKEMGISILSPEQLGALHMDVILDGLLGYSLNGAPRGQSAQLIDFANANPAPILALDVPSGLQATSGLVHIPCISASATMTLALPKTGLKASEAKNQTGRLFCADISVPPALYLKNSLKLDVPNIFALSDIVEIAP